MVDKGDLNKQAISTSETQSDPTEAATSAKKEFVVPEISVPVDVLEATTFFQLTDSGATN